MTARKLDTLIYLIFASAFLMSRIWLIEGDLAPFDITSYQKIDAFYYASLAFEWLEGAHEPAVLQNGITALPGGILYNIIVYANLSLLGDNYYGFRLNVIFVALATSIIFSWIAAERFGKAGLALSLSFYLISFPWFMASLEVEPTIYRLFHAALVILIMERINRKWHDFWPWWAHFFVAFLAYCGFFFVYVTNFFVIAAILAYQIWRCLRLRSWREFRRVASWNLVALTSASLIWVALNHWMFGGTSLVLRMLFAVGDRVAGAGVSSLDEALWSNFFAMQEFPIFQSIPGSFVVYLASLTVMAAIVVFSAVRMMVTPSISKTPETEDTTIIFSLFGLALFFQTIIVNDYPVRKMVCIMPFAIFGALLLVSLLRSKWALYVFSTVAIAMLAISNVPTVYRELFKNYSENMKQAMISLRPLGDAYVIGGFGHGFRLYNDVRPYLNIYAYTNGHRDLDAYDAAMSGKIEGVIPEFSIQIEVSPKTLALMEERGYVYEREILSGTEVGVGNVALFRWVGR
ncbi:MAG: hypothetical protein IBJ07_06660 [Rhizobiaceae bacterium]|nr:hypothetical protein [Rhizobiaceae bacterium]